jgi:hypothetical protein
MVDQPSYIKCKGLIIKSDTAMKWSQNLNLIGPVTAVKKGNHKICLTPFIAAQTCQEVCQSYEVANIISSLQYKDTFYHDVEGNLRCGSF